MALVVDTHAPYFSSFCFTRLSGFNSPLFVMLLAQYLDPSVLNTIATYIPNSELDMFGTGYVNHTRLGEGGYERGGEEKIRGGGKQSTTENGHEVHEIGSVEPLIKSSLRYMMVMC